MRLMRCFAPFFFSLRDNTVRISYAPMNVKQLKNLPGARKAAMPEFVPPQLATLVEKPPTGEEWFHELKLDGYRLLGHLKWSGSFLDQEPE